MARKVFEEAAFLFDIAACRGLVEEPTNSVCVAFNALLDSDTVHNVHGGHEPWEEWFTVHYGDYFIYQLFDNTHAEAAILDIMPKLIQLSLESAFT